MASEYSDNKKFMTLATGSAFFVSQPKGALSFHSSFIDENPGIFFAAVVERVQLIINEGTVNGTITMRLGSSGNTFTIPPGGKVLLATDGTNWYPLQTTSSGWSATAITAATANAFGGQKLFIDTSSNQITVTLPAAPAVGDEISFMDVADNFDTNALTINPNGKKIFGATANGTVSTEGAAFTIVFTGNTHGWKITEK